MCTNSEQQGLTANIFSAKVRAMSTFARSVKPRADVAARVRGARERAAMSREALATRANVSYSLIVRLEQRGFIPKVEAFAAIAAALGTTVEELLNPNGEAA
jgi:ribosome-binding protein aMBF1 (putative translation factor)